MKSTLFSVSALVLLAANPGGCVHAPEAPASETSVAVARAAAADSTTAAAGATAADDGPADPAIDKLIDAYEAYVDENVKLMQRTLDGDLAAMTDFGPMVEKAQAVHGSLTSAATQKRMTKAQQRRLDDLEAKYERVAQQIERRGGKLPLVLSDRAAEQLEERMENNAQRTQHAMEKVEMQLEDMEKGMREADEAADE